MKILFIVPNLGDHVGFNIGVGILSAVLKKKNHTVRSIQVNEPMGFPLDYARIKKIILDYKPGMIGFSVSTNQFLTGIAIARFIKREVNKDIPLVFGGIHPTLAPDQVLGFDCVDMIVLGEGEKAVVELAEQLEKSGDVSGIKNLWSKKNGKIVRNRLRGFIPLEEVPFMDTRICDFQRMIDLRHGWVDILLSRGCPQGCSYCFNLSYKKTYAKYAGQKEVRRYLRSGDYQSALEGIKSIVKQYKRVRCISFVDDDFLLHDSILGFIRLFHRQIHLPFVINAHINSITPGKLKELKARGCDLIRIGIECGDSKIRGMILNRHVPDNRIKEKIRLIKRYKMRVLTYNLMGFPTETREDVIKTLKLNAACSPDVVRFSMFYAYPGTRIYSICKDWGLLARREEKMDAASDEPYILDFDEDFKLFLEKVQKNFDCYLNYFNEKISAHYETLIRTIENLSRKQYESKSLQKYIQDEKDRISKKLSVDKTKHYIGKFTRFFAVKV
jgi:anaerobic magnesium-protoporphyrin IX monomethyl ester cyclase